MSTALLYCSNYASGKMLPRMHRSNQQCCQYGCPCSVKLAEWEAQYDAANGRPLGLERPRCDSRGDFMGMQYRGSQAFCVAPDGTEIAGFMVNRWEAVDMDCKCERDMYAYQQSGAIGRMFVIYRYVMMDCPVDGPYPERT
ncbi:hypothetical protein DPMN_188026 [Dreissena polymorpha]|uniref:Thyroglobulin type-1 domain-containing protein n=1 Tax=Dreissena polymorpha TaxID=45954 RepID=A0A9D4DRP0_DREPO|nr:hypothetical protein DPMN_188026 [Dreissena polymorpha]